MSYSVERVVEQVVGQEPDKAGAPAEQLPANGGMPSYGDVLGRGLLVGLLGGVGCHLALVVSAMLFTAGEGLLEGGISLGDIGFVLLDAIIFFVIGLIIAAPVGLAIGAVSATLMWVVLRLMPRRDERTRMIVGTICAFCTAILAILIVFLVFEGPNWSRIPVFMDGTITTVFLLETIAVTITGGWFAKRYLEKNA